MRKENRKFNELRNIEITPDVNLYAEGSCLIKCGNTHVICTASVDDKLPQWLKGADKGWVTAEYSLLPRATHTRVNRETKGVNGRTAEIQRLIGRALRSIVNLEALKDFIIHVDCDVIQADGGTRTASITGGFVALYIALEKMVKKGQIQFNPIKESVAAISVGVCDNINLLDLDYDEDSNAEVDANFVLTESGNIVEIQGTAERNPFSKNCYLELLELAQVGIDELINKQKEAIKNAKI
ncbi:MAG: ribonuclease PH [Alphaproteobacteria bacterium]|nr:ribonuclease PH [Alphaproteobacteria bacterium]